ATRLLGEQILADLRPVLLEHLARPRPDALAFVGAVGAEALGIDRRGAGAERPAIVGARLVHLLAGAVEAAAALPATVVLDMAGVVDRGRAIALAGARVGHPVQRANDAESVRGGAAVEAHAGVQWHPLRLRGDLGRKRRLLGKRIRRRYRLAG